MEIHIHDRSLGFRPGITKANISNRITGSAIMTPHKREIFMKEDIFSVTSMEVMELNPPIGLAINSMILWLKMKLSIVVTAKAITQTRSRVRNSLICSNNDILEKSSDMTKATPRRQVHMISQ